MEIYIEYALIQNFLVDGFLLYLTLKTARRLIVWKRLLSSAFIGAVFAVVYPLLPFPNLLLQLLKFAFGGLLVRLAVKKKDGGRYAFTVACFYFYSFLFGGVLLGLYGGKIADRAPIWLVTLGVAAIGALSLWAVKRFFRRRGVEEFLFDCEITRGERTVKAKGFLDSGNRATAGGKPLCFITPDLAYDLLGGDVMTEEATVATVGGETKIKIFRVDELVIYSARGRHRIEKARVSPSVRINGREYKLLLGGTVLDECALERDGNTRKKDGERAV